MRFAGNANVAELSDLLKDESERCVVIVAAAFFDETLARILGDTNERSFYARIEDGRDYAILTQLECDDLHEVRNLRNIFAHNLRAATFDCTATAVVESMNVWQVGSKHIQKYQQLFPGARERFLYVIGMIAFRLQRRPKAASKIGALPEPPFRDISAWPPVTGF
ncbi:MAG: hypothetical protein IID46_11825 [Planctomycetes bacterium]|nr:hypothetical protein [Planctomycetota bacterium]